MQISKLRVKHPAIYARILECQVEQGNKPNDRLQLTKSKAQGNFNWHDTSEGMYFWDAINNLEFEVFYETYPIASQPPADAVADKEAVYKDTLKEVCQFLGSAADDDLREISQFLAAKMELKAPAHYDNSKGSLYKVASDRGWNPYLFDVVKRLERGGKKDPLRQEIEKSIFVLQLWLKEYVHEEHS